MRAAFIKKGSPGSGRMEPDSRLSRATILLIAAGVAVGVVGGIVEGDTWFHGGELVAVTGLAALYGYAIWKNPAEVLKADADVTSQAEGLPPQAVTQQELPRQPVATLARADERRR
jgi:hypothetical protein